jgi:hypothetical protein
MSPISFLAIALENRDDAGLISSTHAVLMLHALCFFTESQLI